MVEAPTPYPWSAMTGPLLLALTAPIPALPTGVPVPDTVRIELHTEHARFSPDATAPWTVGSARLALSGRAGTAILGVKGARRFEKTGVQVELDGYPRLGNDAYGYLSVGVSDDEIFPHSRFGAELFTALPHALEASAGVRHLRFQDADVTLWTGSVGVYRGNWWASVRPFVQTGSGESSVSALLQARHYGAGGAWDWVGARVGFGAGTAEFATEAELARTSAATAALEGRVPLSDRLKGAWSVGWEWEDLARDRTRRRWVGSVGLALILPRS